MEQIKPEVIGYEQVGFDVYEIPKEIRYSMGKLTMHHIAKEDYQYSDGKPKFRPVYKKDIK